MLKRLATMGLSLPIDITVSESNARRPSQRVCAHVFSNPFPEGCFAKVDEGLYVSTPEHCFYQLASELPLIKAVELGFELCGAYTLPNAKAAKENASSHDKGFQNRPPLTTRRELLAFNSKMAGLPGQKQALRPLAYILDGSESPMETILTMLLVLPCKLGGYGLPEPELNSKIRPMGLARQSASKSSYRCDLFWPEEYVVVEYDSDMFHTGSERISQDARKRNTLTTISLCVITVTSRQVFNVFEFEKVAKMLAINLGVRLRHKECLIFPEARRDLREFLLPSS